MSDDFTPENNVKHTIRQALKVDAGWADVVSTLMVYEAGPDETKKRKASDLPLCWWVSNSTDPIGFNGNIEVFLDITILAPNWAKCAKVDQFLRKNYTIPHLRPAGLVGNGYSILVMSHLNSRQMPHEVEWEAGGKLVKHLVSSWLIRAAKST